MLFEKQENAYKNFFSEKILAKIAGVWSWLTTTFWKLAVVCGFWEVRDWLAAWADSRLFGSCL
jgi:hypothetical protein